MNLVVQYLEDSERVASDLSSLVAPVYAWMHEMKAAGEMSEALWAGFFSSKPAGQVLALLAMGRQGLGV